MAHQLGSAIFSCYAETQIDAPPRFVHQKLADTSSWPKWNTFIPRADIKTTRELSKSDGHRRLELGQHVHFHVYFPIFGKRRNVPGGSVEKVVRNGQDEMASVETYHLEWDQILIPQFLLRTHRVNMMFSIPDQPGCCRYVTHMTFDGPFAYFIKSLLGEKLQAEFDEWAHNLKGYVEQEQAELSNTR